MAGVQSTASSSDIRTTLHLLSVVLHFNNWWLNKIDRLFTEYMITLLHGLVSQPLIRMYPRSLPPPWLPPNRMILRSLFRVYAGSYECLHSWELYFPLWSVSDLYPFTTLLVTNPVIIRCDVQSVRNQRLINLLPNQRSDMAWVT